MKIKYFIKVYIAVLIVLCCAYFVSCTEIEYTEIDKPAYLRVFNNLNYEVTLDNRFERPPFLTMLIDPEYDKDGIPVSAAIVGDFLAKRELYAAPYPTHSAGSVSKENPEYPGKENVLVGPMLNGFDLSSWAQIPSGKHRIVFMFRPINEIPFFQLETRLKQDIAVDTEIELTPGEIYTLHVLQKDYITKENGIILRQENFHKQPFSDSLVYVNFYNMSAKGFVESDNDSKPSTGYSTLQYGIQEESNVFLTLYPQDATEYNEKTALLGYWAQYLTSVKRNTEEGTVSPYFSFPLFADSRQTIITDMIQHITFLAPGLQFLEIGTGGQTMPRGLCSHLTFYKEASISLPGRANTSRFPSMFINTHSGIYNPRSFAAVNTIEVVNGEAYLTTIQRKYDPPIY